MLGRDEDAEEDIDPSDSNSYGGPQLNKTNVLSILWIFLSVWSLEKGLLVLKWMRNRRLKIGFVKDNNNFENQRTKEELFIILIRRVID